MIRELTQAQKDLELIMRKKIGIVQGVKTYIDDINDPEELIKIENCIIYSLYQTRGQQ